MRKTSWGFRKFKNKRTNKINQGIFEEGHKTVEIKNEINKIKEYEKSQ